MLFFFFNDTATTEIYTLSLHDALPISDQLSDDSFAALVITAVNQTRSATLALGFVYSKQHLAWHGIECGDDPSGRDRKSTRLNSSHGYISYAVFCLKKKKKLYQTRD